MNRLSITRKLTVYMLQHPKALEAYLRVSNKMPTLPKGYRKITKK
jgi:hypothetical protein